MVAKFIPESHQIFVMRSTYFMSCGNEHGSKLKAGDNYQPNHFVPCLFLPNHKLKRKATCGIIRTKKKAPRLQVQTKLPFWTSKFNDTFVFPRANNSGSCVVKNNSQNGSFVSSTISSVSSTASFNNSSVTSTISLCSPTASCIDSPVVVSSFTPTTSSISSLARFKYTGPSSTMSSCSSIDFSSSSSVVISSLPAVSSTQSNIISFAQGVRPSCSSSTSSSESVPKDTISSSDITLNSDQFDVCNFRAKVKELKSNNDIKELINKVFVPDSKFVFPKTRGRRFKYNWLSTYPWLSYSPSLDGSFCLPCVLFGDKFPLKVLKIRKLFSEPFTYWPDAQAAFKRHENCSSGIHTECMRVYNTILSNSLPVNVLIDNNRKNTIMQNRQKLVPIVDAIIVCGRQGLALRGHRDDSKYQPDLGSYSTEQTGNFVELLNFRIRGGDKALEEHLSKCPKNATYISKTTQNELIECCGKVIVDQVLSEIKFNQFFAVMADEPR